MEAFSNVNTSALKDKSLWLAIAAPIMVMAGKVFGIDLDVPSILAMLGPVVAFIVSSKAKQAAVAKVESQSAASVESAKNLLAAASAGKPNA